jgi:hypothetical protein
VVREGGRAGHMFSLTGTGSIFFTFNGGISPDPNPIGGISSITTSFSYLGEAVSLDTELPLSVEATQAGNIL